MSTPKQNLSPCSSNASVSGKMGLASNKPQSSTVSVPRPKRSQVSRACDWCRVHRIKVRVRNAILSKTTAANKLSSVIPSSHAKTVETGALPAPPRVPTRFATFLMLSGAFSCHSWPCSQPSHPLTRVASEIERLRCRVKELEQEVENQKDTSSFDRRRDSPHPGGSPFSTHTRRPSSPFRPQPVEYDPEIGTKHQADPKRRSLGVFSGDGHVKQWFGPTSLVYFISRMTSHLGQFGGHPLLDQPIHWSSTTPSFSTAGLIDSTTDLPPQDLQDGDALDSKPCSGPCHLSPLQEEYFLAMFWQSYHCYLQIVDETSFREMYRALWTNGAKKRKPSALVDIILALCVQYDTALPLRRGRFEHGPPWTKDSIMAGRYLYQRCQTLLVAELENPTISTLQCQIFSYYYLCCASFQNMAHSMLATAVRTAQLLGLHLEPPEDLPRPERELRKRIWWTLYGLESKTCIKLGRPWLASMSDITCSLPADDHALAIQSGSAVLAGDNVTWLTYTLQMTKLMLANRSIYLSFHRDLARLTATSDATDIYTDSCLLETLSASLLTHISQTLTPWTAAVPDAMRCQRLDPSADAFAPTPCKYPVLSIETFAPLWLQRQRLFLELIYHNFAMTLYRPLLDFSPGLTGSSSSTSPSSSLPAPKTSTEICADACVDHAITLTSIAHQALSETDVLKGCHEIFQWQWNAAITLLGYQLACPGSDRASAAREAVDVALQVFEIFGRHFEVGKNAGKVVRDLLVRIDSLAGGGFGTEDGFFNLGNLGSEGFLVDDGTHPNGAWDGSDHCMAIDHSLAAMPPVNLPSNDISGVYPGLLSGGMDGVFSVDSFSGFDASFSHGGNSAGFEFADQWAFPRSA